MATHPARHGRVEAAYVAKYPRPIRLRGGEAVRVGRGDDEWPGWHWCEAPDGRVGWVPGSLLEATPGGHVARADYDATELTVEAGEVVELTGEEESGWAWCRSSAGAEGWLPLRVLKPA